MAVDVAPGARVGEGEVVGGDAHYGAVFFVVLLGFEALGAGQVLDSPGELGGAVEERAREGAEGVEV